MKYKVVTTFLHDRSEGAYGDAQANRLFGIVEHFEQYLAAGWVVKDLKTMGGAGGRLSGWIVAVLEKPQDQAQQNSPQVPGWPCR